MQNPSRTDTQTDTHFEILAQPEVENKKDVNLLIYFISSNHVGRTQNLSKLSTCTKTKISFRTTPRRSSHFNKFAVHAQDLPQTNI